MLIRDLIKAPAAEHCGKCWLSDLTFCICDKYPNAEKFGCLELVNEE